MAAAATSDKQATAKAGNPAERRTIRISIEGNIAAGKSTFLRILSQSDMDFIVVPEPVQKWQALPADDDEAWVQNPRAHGLAWRHAPLLPRATLCSSASQQDGCNLLHAFYEDPKKWGFCFQTYAMLSRSDSAGPPTDTCRAPLTPAFPCAESAAWPAACRSSRLPLLHTS